jgi:uncharacterized protein (DUF2147 family)
MKRFYYLAVLMAISSSTQASESFSFAISGHRIRIESSRHCYSSSCVSVSIPGFYQPRGKRDRNDDVAAAPEPAPAKPPASAPEPVRAVIAPASKPAVQAVAPTPAPSATQAVSPPPPIAQVPSPPSPVATVRLPEPAKIPPAVTPPLEAPVVTENPAPDSAPKLSTVSQETQEEVADTPIGDWQTEGKKGLVRVEKCGTALCGYVLNPASDAKGESVLINMKPKSETAWTGNIFSRNSGNTYYATMAMKGPNTLRVEACVVGRFFCSGNDWTRISVKPAKLITSSAVSPEPKS